MIIAEFVFNSITLLNFSRLSHFSSKHRQIYLTRSKNFWLEMSMRRTNVFNFVLIMRTNILTTNSISDASIKVSKQNSQLSTIRKWIEYVERLNQILMRKINIMIKNSDLIIKWWLEIIRIANLYRNIILAIDFHDKTNRSINFFEMFTSHMYNYAHIQIIDQIDETLNIKSQID